MTIFSSFQQSRLMPAQRCSIRPSLRLQQRGTIMIMALIALLILMLAGVALIYSTNTSLLTSGNMAFKRDLSNQSELAVQKVLEKFTSGTLAPQSALQTDHSDENYYAHVLPSTNAKLPGIPDVLLVASMASNAKNLKPAVGVELRYVIDRMCVAGTTIPDQVHCTIATLTPDKSGTAGVTKVRTELGPVYRISIMALGPRNTQTFTQVTFTH